MKAVRKDGRGFRLPVAVAVFDDDDGILRLLTGLDLGIGRGTRDPEPSLGIEIHVDGFTKQGIAGVE